MSNVFEKAKSQLQQGDIKAISEKSGIAYATVYKAINGKAKCRKQNEILKTVTEFLKDRKESIEKLDDILS